MSILIIGSKGFIGSSLAKILSDSFDIFGCDIMADEEPSYFQIDAFSLNYSTVFQSNKFDYCINCAGSANVQRSIVEPYMDFTLNLSCLVKILDAIRISNPECKLINISSAAVYGNPLALPVKVGDRTEPLSPYGVHKMLADITVSKYAKIFGLSTCSVRIFSAYGNGQKKLFLWDCLQKLLHTNNNRTASFYGTGLESRDYIHIVDIAQQIRLILQNAPFIGEVYNIANGEEILIRDIVDLIQIELGSRTKILFTGEKREGDPLNWKADITPLLQWGYDKKISIRDGVKEYVLWAKANNY